MRTITASGVTAAALALVAAAAGILLGYPTLVLVAVALALALALGAMFLFRTPRVSVKRSIEPARVTVGDPARDVLVVRNDSDRRSPVFRAVEQYGTTTLHLRLPRLRSGRAGRVVQTLPTHRRGVIKVGPLRIDRSDPLGLYQRYSPLAGSDILYVHPRVHVVPALAAGTRRDLEGPESQRAPLGTVIFQSLREYRVGDDRRHIHWRSSARMGELMVKEHIDISQPRAVVVLDLASERYDPEGFELAVEMAASAALSFVMNNFPVRLVTTDGRGVGRDGSQDATGLLDFLAGVEPVESADLAGFVTQLATERNGNALVVITATATTDQLAAVAALRRRFQRLILLTVEQQPETIPPAAAGVHSLAVTNAKEFVSAWRTLARYA